MKLAVFSDSHGHPDAMLAAIAQSSPDMVIHLGDGERDVQKIESQFPSLPLRAVRGNCDLASLLPETGLFMLGSKTIFFTHGHLFGVKTGLSRLTEKGRALGAELVLFGHTHNPAIVRTDTLMFVNPGSCGYGSMPSYAEITITDSGEILPKIIPL